MMYNTDLHLILQDLVSSLPSHFMLLSTVFPLEMLNIYQSHQKSILVLVQQYNIHANNNTKAQVRLMLWSQHCSAMQKYLVISSMKQDIFFRLSSRSSNVAKTGEPPQCQCVCEVRLQLYGRVTCQQVFCSYQYQKACMHVQHEQITTH